MPDFLRSLWWLLYPSTIGAVVGLAQYGIFIVLIFAALKKWWGIVRIAISLISAYFLTWITTFFPYSIQGTNAVFRDQMVGASGWPFTMFTADSGMTDPSVHEWAVLMNIAIYFGIVLLLLTPDFYKRISLFSSSNR